MGTVSLVIVNEYQGDLGVELSKVCEVLDQQITEDFLPYWKNWLNWKGQPIDSVTVSQKAVPDFGDWQFDLVGGPSDVQGALAYHAKNKWGMPYGRIFVDVDKQAGDEWTTDLSHELLEALADPLINEHRQVQGLDIALEVADPVQDETYQIDDVTLSNFVVPSWFQLETGMKVDFLDQLSRPTQLSGGGYMSVLRHGRWQSLFGSKQAATKFDHRNHHRLNVRHGE